MVLMLETMFMHVHMYLFFYIKDVNQADQCKI